MNIPALSNQALSETHTPDDVFYLFPTDITGYFAMWVVRQTPRGQPLILLEPLQAFTDYIIPFFDHVLPSKFTYNKLEKLIDADTFSTILEIRQLNETRPDFIDLHALARNIFFDVIREARINYGINKNITDGK